VTTSRQKTGTHVNVLLPPEVSDELLAVVNSNPKYFFWNTGEGKPQIAVTNWRHDLRDVFRSAGTPDGRPHQLRDTFAVGLLEKGRSHGGAFKSTRPRADTDDREALQRMGKSTAGSARHADTGGVLLSR
jgi:integrase